MKVLKLLIVIVLFSSCGKKEIQLPKIGEKGLTDLFEISSIWIFYEQNGKDTIGVLNKNNKIGNTNLIFNIDKRLPIREVLPKVHKIQEKLKEPSMHETVGKRNYFNYADTLSGTFALLDFTEIHYIFKKEDYKKYTENFPEGKPPVTISVNKNTVLINNTRTDDLFGSLDTLIKNDSLKQRNVFLIFDERTLYQQYLTLKVQLYNRGFNQEKTEYIKEKE